MKSQLLFQSIFIGDFYLLRYCDISNISNTEACYDSFHMQDQKGSRLTSECNAMQDMRLQSSSNWQFKMPMLNCLQ